jgi:hypothetical protein
MGEKRKQQIFGELVTLLSCSSIGTDDQKFPARLF